MHKLSLLILLLLLVSCSSDVESVNTDDYDGNIPGLWITLEEAQEFANEERKFILLDIYADWCDLCKRMQNETYSDAQVQEVLQAYFYPVRVDSESDKTVTFLGKTYSESDLASKFGVFTLPTTIFLDPEGEPLAVQPGFIHARRFEQMLTFVGTEAFENSTFESYIRND